MITISMMSQSTAAELALHSINGESKIKNKLRPLKLPDNFPSDVVMQAFLQPNIAKIERNEFEWKLPRLHDIRMFCHEVMKVDGFVFFKAEQTFKFLQLFFVVFKRNQQGLFINDITSY